MIIGGVDVHLDGRTVSWTSGMSIDGDGSPRAYSPFGSAQRGLDYLANAGAPGNWYGLACDEHSDPIVQGKDDPAPGYYVSTTALRDHGLPAHDPRSYVDSERVPYIAVPRPLLASGVRLGDFAVVGYGPLKCGAIVADIGPAKHIGEGSIALAEALGMKSDPRRGGVSALVRYCIYLGSAGSPAWPRVDVSRLALELERELAFT